MLIHHYAILMLLFVSSWRTIVTLLGCNFLLYLWRKDANTGLLYLRYWYKILFSKCI